MGKGLRQWDAVTPQGWVDKKYARQEASQRRRAHLAYKILQALQTRVDEIARLALAAARARDFKLHDALMLELAGVHTEIRARSPAVADWDHAAAAMDCKRYDGRADMMARSPVDRFRRRIL